MTFTASGKLHHHFWASKTAKMPFMRISHRSLRDSGHSVRMPSLAIAWTHVIGVQAVGDDSEGLPRLPSRADTLHNHRLAQF